MFKPLFVFSTLALSLLALSALGTTARAQFQYTYIGTDTTLNASDPISGHVYIGFANANDFNNGRANPVSPTVTLVSGGSVDNEFQIFNNSTLNMSGGTVGSPAGTLNGIYGFDNSRITLSGGSVRGSLSAADNSTVKMSGGSVGERLEATNSAIISLSGGSVGGILQAATNSTVNLSGGSINGYFQISNSGTLNVFGTGLAALLVDPSFSFDPNDPFLPRYSQYDLSGTLSDGTVLVNKELDVQNGTGARFLLFNTPAAVPEPGSLALFVGLCASGAGVFTRRRSRK